MLGKIVLLVLENFETLNVTVTGNLLKWLILLEINLGCNDVLRADCGNLLMTDTNICYCLKTDFKAHVVKKAGFEAVCKFSANDTHVNKATVQRTSNQFRAISSLLWTKLAQLKKNRFNRTWMFRLASQLCFPIARRVGPFLRRECIYDLCNLSLNYTCIALLLHWAVYLHCTQLHHTTLHCWGSSYDQS